MTTADHARELLAVPDRSAAAVAAGPLRPGQGACERYGRPHGAEVTHLSDGTCNREGWPHWLDGDGDCQDLRQEVLVVESLERARLDLGSRQVVSGLSHDAYTGETVRDPGELDVDHLMPLAEANRSGGHA